VLTERAKEVLEKPNKEVGEEVAANNVLTWLGSKKYAQKAKLYGHGSD